MTTPVNKTHLIVGSILVALQILNGGAALGDVIGDQAFGLFALVVAAAQGGWQFYVSGSTTPNDKVAATQIDGKLVAGPAAGVSNGTPVAVSQLPPNTTPGSTAY